MTKETDVQLAQMEERIKDEMREGFKGINDRLDKINGRVRTTEMNGAAQAVRIDTLEREMGQVRKAGRVTFGQLRVWVSLVIGAVIATVAVLTFLGKLKS